MFLSTEWRDLAILNYAIDPAIARPFVPRGTELDAFHGTTYASLVGLRFARTKILDSFSVPLHTNFDEVNLRIYVRRTQEGDSRRGVVFIREIVSLPLLSFIARLSHGENYSTMRLRHAIEMTSEGGSIEYTWRTRQNSFRLYAKAGGNPAPVKQGSLEEFITEHYWGYTRQPDGTTLEYRVSHEPWRLWHAGEARFEGNGAQLYGAEFGSILSRWPDSAFIAEGSPVQVFMGRRIE